MRPVNIVGSGHFLRSFQKPLNLAVLGGNVGGASYPRLGPTATEFCDEGLPIGKDEPRKDVLLDLCQFICEQLLEGGLVELSRCGHEATA